MENTAKICAVCGEKATGTIKDDSYCKKHFNELVLTKPIRKTNAIQNRNEICACGSGKKFKHCCSIKANDHKPRHYFNSEYIHKQQTKKTA